MLQNASKNIMTYKILKRLSSLKTLWYGSSSLKDGFPKISKAQPASMDETTLNMYAPERTGR